MAPYFKSSFLQLPDQTGLKKSKSETCIEMQNEVSGRTRHDFIDYQTVKSGEKCYACSHRMRDIWVKQCQGKKKKTYSKIAHTKSSIFQIVD